MGLALLLAGCSGPTPSALQAPPGTDLDGTGGLDLIPGERAVAASFTYREASAGSSNPFFSEPGWEPRDVEVTYHGIQEVHDEFARPTQAFVFRVPEMVVVSGSGLAGTGLGQSVSRDVHVIEYHFERSDGRLIGTIDLTAGQRSFSDPSLRHPVASPAVFFMAVKALEGNMSRTFTVDRLGEESLVMHLDPYDGEPAFPGDCTMWEASFHWESTGPGGVGGEDAEGADRIQICLDDEQVVPLWLRRAAEGESGEGYTLQRMTAPFALPPYAGTVLPPVVYERKPWTPAMGLLPLGDPILVPPHEDGGTWAKALGDRAAALQLEPIYRQYRQSADEVYMRIGVAGVSSAPFVRVLNVTVPFAPESEQSSLFILSDGAHGYLGRVSSVVGDAEDPDVHRPVPPGTMFDDDEADATHLPLLVGDASLEGQLAPFVPPDVDAWAFTRFSFDNDDWPLYMLGQSCTAERDGWALHLAADTGAAWTLQRTVAGSCADAPAAARLPLLVAPAARV